MPARIHVLLHHSWKNGGCVGKRKCKLNLPNSPSANETVPFIEMRLTMLTDMPVFQSNNIKFIYENDAGMNQSSCQQKTGTVRFSILPFLPANRMGSPRLYAGRC